MARDTLITEPLNSLLKKITELEEIILSLDIIFADLTGLLPFTKKNKRKVRNVIRGRVFARTQKKLQDMNKLNSEITGLFGFYEVHRKLTPRSRFALAKKRWTTASRRVYLSALGKFLDFNIEGTIMKRLHEEKYEETTEEEINGLRKTAINGFLAILTPLKKEIDNIQHEHKSRGLSKKLF
jgi:hypothetical protein